MAASTINVFLKSENLMVGESEAFMVLASQPTTEQHAFCGSGFTSQNVAIESSQIEIDVGDKPMSNLLVSCSATTRVTLPPVSDNLAEAEALALILGETESGLRLEVLGAFNKPDFSAFFWG